MSKRHNVGLFAVCAAVVAAGAVPALAFPDYGTRENGHCYACHSEIVSGRMELLDFAGMVDPVEMQGIPDQGSLKYYSAPAGGNVAMSIHAINGASKYAFQITGFDDHDVTNGGTLVYADDTSWLTYRGNFNTYFCKADGGLNAYDWGTSDPTTVTYNLNVDASTPPGYYLLTFALAGKESNEWYDGEFFYLEVTGGSSGPTLAVTPTCPGGGPITITWSGATGGGTIALIFARNTGNFHIPNNYACSGTPLGLGSNQVQLAYQGPAGASGGRTLNSTAGSGACGGYFQLLDVATCGTSNVVQAN